MSGETSWGGGRGWRCGCDGAAWTPLALQTVPDVVISALATVCSPSDVRADGVGVAFMSSDDTFVMKRWI